MNLKKSTVSYKKDWNEYYGIAFGFEGGGDFHTLLRHASHRMF
jgi:hypothetical protein